MLNLSEQSWVSLDLSATSLDSTFNGRVRAGYRALGDLSLGVEAGLGGNLEYASGRAGGFARYAWTWGELSASAGPAGGRGSPTGAYGTVSALFRF